MIGGLRDPLDFAIAAGDRVYVAEKGGRIAVHEADGAFVANLVDLSAQVNDRQDRGLLDIALHPDFPAQPYLYAFAVIDPPGAAGETGNAAPDGGGNRYAHVLRMEVADDGLSIVPGSQTVLIGAAGRTYDDVSGRGAVDSTDPATVDVVSSERLFEDGDVVVEGLRQDYLKVDSRSHAGGALAFGPDGMLYVSTGDGTSFNFADPRTLDVQSLDSLSGKVLRVDPITGLGLADNPFAEAGDDLSLNRAKVFQLGLRNPFSMGFDEDGRLFVTDTGWFTFEEVNRGQPGANFGWPFYEGGDAGVLEPAPRYRDFPEAAAFYAAVAAGEIELTAAYRAFAHRDDAPGFQAQAITGGNAFVPEDGYPEALAGDYVFADVSQGEVFAVDADDRREVSFLYQTQAGFGPVHFGEGPDGALWYVDTIRDEIGRLRITGGPEPEPDPEDRFQLRLIDAAADVVLDGDLSDGAASLAPGLFGSLAIQVVGRGDATVSAPVRIQIDGPNGFSSDKTENFEPFASFGDDLEGDFAGRGFAAGGYSVTVTANGVTETTEFALAAQPSGTQVVGQVGRTTVSTANADSWTRVTFERALDDPIVVAGPPTTEGGQPGMVRVRDVTATGFEMQIDEWSYLDGFHLPETVGWVAVERGEHVLSNGARLVADTAQVGSGARDIAFGTALEDATVLAQVASTVDDAPVTQRVFDVDADGFGVLLQEEEAADGFHPEETLAWLAVAGGGGDGIARGPHGGRRDPGERADRLRRGASRCGLPRRDADARRARRGRAAGAVPGCRRRDGLRPGRGIAGRGAVPHHGSSGVAGRRDRVADRLRAATRGGVGSGPTPPAPRLR